MPRTTDPLEPWIRHQDPIHLVTWVKTADGDKPMTVSGILLDHNRTNWTVRVGSKDHKYPRTVWTPCLP